MAPQLDYAKLADAVIDRALERWETWQDEPVSSPESVARRSAARHWHDAVNAIVGVRSLNLDGMRAQVEAIGANVAALIQWRDAYEKRAAERAKKREIEEAVAERIGALTAIPIGADDDTPDFTPEPTRPGVPRRQR